MISDGESVDIVADAPIQTGDVVVRGALVLVAMAAIAAGKRGGCRARGGFELPKDPGEKIPQGTPVYWSERKQRVSAKREEPDDRYAGATFADAGAGAHTAQLLLNHPFVEVGVAREETKRDEKQPKAAPDKAAAGS